MANSRQASWETRVRFENARMSIHGAPGYNVGSEQVTHPLLQQRESKP
jgi:hypothetical protein